MKFRYDSTRRVLDRVLMYRQGAWMPWHWRYVSGGGGMPERYRSRLWFLR